VLSIKENPGEPGFYSAASDGHRHTPRGHNLNYTIWTLYAESVSSHQAPFTQGAWALHPGARALHQGARSSSRGARPSPRGAPFSQGQALYNLSSSFERALTSRGVHSSILLGKLKHNLSHL
jgi:hypothetical protein